MKKREQFDPIDPVDDAEPADFAQRTWAPEQLMTVKTGRDEPRVHPVAALFPMMSDEELDNLAADIKANGLIHPIVRDADGQIVDGRNREEACYRAGIEPTFVELNGSDAVARIAGENSKRRNMSKAQTAMVAADAYLLKFSKTQEQAARLFGVSRQYVDWAITVRQYAPDLADSVRDGDERLDKAYETARQRKVALESDADRRKRQDAEKALLREEAPDLAALVADKDLPLSDAMAALRQRQLEKQQRRQVVSMNLSRILKLIDAGEDAPAKRASAFLEADVRLSDGEMPFTSATVGRAALVLDELARQLAGQENGHRE